MIASRRTASQTTKQRRTKGHAPCLLPEPLESRRLFAADLVGSAITVAGGGHPINAGDPHQVTVTVKNQNGLWFLDDAGTFQVNVYLSDDSTITSDDIQVAAWTVPSLGAGQSVSQTLTLTLPSTDPFRTDNQYYFGAIVDANNQVNESNETNNANRGDGLDRVAISAERHLVSPTYTGGQIVGAETLSLGTPAYGVIGGADFEWMGGYDIDTYMFSGAAGRTIAFDLDTTGGSLNSYMRIYRDNAAGLDAANDDGAAPGEVASTTDSFLTYTIPASNVLYYLVVSSKENQSSDPSRVSGRTDGSQGSFVVNTVELPAPPSFPDLLASSDTGVSPSDNITNNDSPTFTFYGTAGLTGQLLINGNVAGTVTDTAGTGQYTVTAPPRPDGTYAVSARLLNPVTGYAGNASPPTQITIDTTAPTLQIPMSFYYAGAPQQVTMRFSEDVGATLNSGQMSFHDLGSPAVYDANLTYNAQARDAAFAVQGAGVLPQGNYRPVLDPTHVTDLAGNPLTGATSADFFVLPGDANHDRKVDLSDFTILAANFNQSNRNFTQGNFNYDTAGKVDLTDFTILAANFNKSLPAPAATTTATTTTAALRAAPPTAPPMGSVFSASSITSRDLVTDVLAAGPA